MRKADRLFQIVQILRRERRPVTAESIAQELETSKRSVYRDIAALLGQRVPIRGEAGIGYVLEDGFDLPPLMLGADEVDAVALGLQWVGGHADPALLRGWIRKGRKLAIRYSDEGGAASERTVWPLLIGYLDRARFLIAWCELREGFRHFRLDRIAAAEFLDERIPRDPAHLRRQWRASLGAGEGQ